MPFARTNDINTYYEIQGNGSPLLLISGLNCDHTILWETVRTSLAKEFKVITYSPRGILPTTSSENPYTISTMAEDAQALLHHLKIESAHVLGYSMGGMIAQALTIQYPESVDNLILAATTAKTSVLNRFICEGCQNMLAHQVPQEEILALMLPWLFSNQYLTMLAEGTLTHPMPKLTPRTPQKDSHQLLTHLQAVNHFDSREEIVKIDTPTLILCGEKDLLMSPEESLLLQQSIPNARLVVIPHAGHLFIHENPTIFLQMVSAFLKS